MNKKIISLIILLAIVTTVFFVTASNQSAAKELTKTLSAQDKTITIFKSPECGCCSNYGSYMKKQGFTVNVIERINMDEVKEEYEIPSLVGSCHTTLIGDYFIEGHIPVEAVIKLLTEKPDIKGIGLANMPSGTPGMPGAKRGSWTIYQVENDGNTSVFTVV